MTGGVEDLRTVGSTPWDLKRYSYLAYRIGRTLGEPGRVIVFDPRRSRKVDRSAWRTNNGAADSSRSKNCRVGVFMAASRKAYALVGAPRIFQMDQGPRFAEALGVTQGGEVAPPSARPGAIGENALPTTTGRRGRRDGSPSSFSPEFKRSGQALSFRGYVQQQAATGPSCRISRAALIPTPSCGWIFVVALPERAGSWVGRDGGRPAGRRGRQARRTRRGPDSVPGQRSYYSRAWVQSRRRVQA